MYAVESVSDRLTTLVNMIHCRVPVCCQWFRIEAVSLALYDRRHLCKDEAIALYDDALVPTLDVAVSQQSCPTSIVKAKRRQQSADDMSLSALLLVSHDSGMLITRNGLLKQGVCV